MAADTFRPIEHAPKLVELIPATTHLWLAGVRHHEHSYPDMSAVTGVTVSHLDGAI